MNVTLLIDSIVRQTTVLIAQLATAAGSRAPLAHTANQVFLDLVAELRAQGLGNKVIADMFGLALRTYHGKVQRLSESSTFRGRSLWSAVLEHVQEQETVRRSDLLRRFHYDDETTLKGVLNDLVDSGLLFRSGRGESTVFRAARIDEQTLDSEASEERLRHLVWVAIHGFGPLGLDELSKVVPTEIPLLERAVSQLLAEGKVTREECAQIVRFRSDHCLIPLESSAGWEAAVFDHYQAMVTAICTKLALGRSHAELQDIVGGSTYHFDVWEEHPHYDEVRGHLAELRKVSIALRERVDAYNNTHAPPVEGRRRRFITYVGQTLRTAEGEIE
ncbi:MAG: hypothetical protein RJA70_131 [Pseudomonadota bacterium]|jgi:hypothetical protein